MRDPEVPPLADGKIALTCFDGGWCTLQNANCARARRAAEAAGDSVIFRRVDTVDHEARERWRQDYGIYLDTKQIGTGPPLSQEKVQRRIETKQRPWWSLRKC